MFQNIYVTNRNEDEEATVYLWDDTRGLLTFPYKDFDYAYKLDKNGEVETIFGEKATKTFRWQDNASAIYESDVPRETRVLTDLYLDSDAVSTGHRTLFFDIEVSSIGGFASVARANNEITAIGCYDEANNKELMFLWDRDNLMHPKIQDIKGCVVQAFDTESKMLTAFMDFYTELKPTILVGWNSNQYDIPYLYHRLTHIFDTDTANMLSPIGMVKFSKYRSRYQIAGVSCLDYLEMYQKFTFSRRPSYRLDAIGQYEVGMGKIPYDGTLDDLFANDLPKFIDYNLQDVRIVVEIDKKMKLVDLVKNISHVGHTQYDDYQYSSKYIEGTILVYLHRQGRVSPNKRPEGREEFNQRLEDDEEGFAGAFVKPPMPGLYDWVYNLDLQSLYPSIIMTLNISPETKIGYVKNWNAIEHNKNKNGKYIVEIGSVQNVLTYDQFMQFMNDEKCMLSSNGVLYRSDKLGIIPEILDKWFGERLEFKKLQKEHKKAGNAELASYYDRRQHVQKILLNSIYGVLGLPIFRFYDLDNALAVTATAQDVIKTTAKFISNRYRKSGVPERSPAQLEKYEEVLRSIKPALNEPEIRELLDPNDLCIYIDTDSVYFRAIRTTDDPLQDTITTAKDAEAAVNEFYDVMAKRLFFCEKHRLVIKGESVNETALWTGKKRYAKRQVYDLESDSAFSTPKLSITGLDVVRSSFPPAFKEVMSKALDYILQQGGKSGLDADILAFRKHMNTLEFPDVARNTSVKDISSHDKKSVKDFVTFPKGCAAHVKAAITYNRWLRVKKLDATHEPIRDGDKIKWTYLKKNPLNADTMALKGYDDPPELIEFIAQYMDYNRLYEKELLNKLSDFYSALGWGLVPTEVNQHISNFFTFDDE